MCLIFIFKASVFPEFVTAAAVASIAVPMEIITATAILEIFTTAASLKVVIIVASLEVVSAALASPKVIVAEATLGMAAGSRERVELKRADVALLVGFLFLETLLKLTVLLETVLLRHLAFLLVGLDDAAL